MKGIDIVIKLVIKHLVKQTFKVTLKRFCDSFGKISRLSYIEWKCSNFYTPQIRSDEINGEIVRLHHNDGFFV